MKKIIHLSDSDKAKALLDGKGCDSCSTGMWCEQTMELACGSWNGGWKTWPMSEPSKDVIRYMQPIYSKEKKDGKK